MKLYFRATFRFRLYVKKKKEDLGWIQIPYFVGIRIRHPCFFLTLREDNI